MYIKIIFQQCAQVSYTYEPQCTTVYEQACTQVPVQVPRTISVPRYAISHRYRYLINYLSKIKHIYNKIACYFEINLYNSYQSSTFSFQRDKISRNINLQFGSLNEKNNFLKIRVYIKLKKDTV